MGSGRTSGSTGAPGRLRSLDGLRGAAALVVLVHHPMLLFPSLAAVYYPATPALSGWVWALSYTPLHLVWAGTEAVYLFFVLSGLVLVLPVLARPDFGWLAYYPRRLVRLYGPVVGAVGLGLVAYAVAPRFNAPGLGAWVNARANDYPGSAVLRDLTLVAGHSGRISPLWSLQWEVLFSLLLPLLVLAIVPGRRYDGFRAVTLLALLAVGSATGVEPLFYLPMFAVGVLTAVRWRSIESWTSDCAARWGGFWPAVSVLGVLLTCARWEAGALGVTADLSRQLAFLAVVGVWLLVLAAGLSPRIRRLFETRFLQWAGRISFSLYLVHEPIVLSVRFRTAASSPWVAVAIGVPLALIVAALFERCVEAPCHRLSRRVGRASASRFASAGRRPAARRPG